MTDNFKRWKIGPFASGAYSETGGHWKVLGFMRSWVPSPCRLPGSQAFHWRVKHEMSLFGAFACQWGDGHPFQWAFFSARIEFRRARWRYGEREKARIRRDARRRFDNARAALTNGTRT